MGLKSGLRESRQQRPRKLWILSLTLCVVLSACGGAGGGDEEEDSEGGVVSVGGNLSCANAVTGRVISENPRRELAGPNNPAFNANLSGLGFNTTITDLDGTCLLRNQFVSVTADDSFPNSIANAADGNALVYDAEDPRFRQVNSYYYANELANLVQANGGGLSGMSSVAIFANCNISENAFFFPGGNLICLGKTSNGSKTLWAGHDADVIVHEYGHAVNNRLASNSILSSSGEAGAIDEGVSDYWAHTVSGNPDLSEWFLGAIDVLIGGAFTVTRDASDNNSYPNSMVYEVHDDSRPFAEVLWTIRQNLGKTKTDALVNRMLQNLPATTRFINASNSLETAAALQALPVADRNFITDTLTNKGLKRSDSAVGVSISNNAGNKAVYVIDDHAISQQSNGNCNGALDVNETALVLVNFENSGATMGMAAGRLVALSGGVTIPSGGDVGEYFRIPGSGADFADVLNEVAVRAVNSTTNHNATIAAAFLVQANSAGTKNFRVTLSPAGGSSRSFDFSLDVGNVANSANCDDDSLWPDGRTPN